MKAFLKPLSISQEKYYLLKYKEGDLHAKNLLIEHNLRLVAHVVKKYQGVDEETDDLISIGTIGLSKPLPLLIHRRQHVSPPTQPGASKMRF